jgi:hypothetical protein
MRRVLIILATMALAGGLLPAGALPGDLGPVDAATGLVDEIGPGYVATDNVEYLGTIPINADSAGARVLDDHLYITDDRGLTIYDISTPTAPVRRGFALLPQSPYIVEEDPETNGEVMLISSYTDATRGLPGPLSVLYVLDVSDKANPRIQGQLQGAQQHTWSCVLDCTWGYGSGGLVADLRDPTAPKRGTAWLAQVQAQLAALGTPMRQAPHDVTEVAPGFVLASMNPVTLLDARDPEAPKVIAVGTLPDGRFVHGNLWPSAATDTKLLVGGETVGDCSTQQSGAFMTFDASEVSIEDEAIAEAAAAGAVQRFTFLDDHRVFTGLPTDGDSFYDQFCAHWFTEHPDFDGGGLVAMGWYEHGVRFLDVAANGDIDEVGWFLPIGGSTSAAYWITDEIVYTSDYQRGIDILRFTGEPATGEVRVEGTTPALPKVRSTRMLPPTEGVSFICPLPGI